MQNSFEELFGDVISTYSRAQAIADGVLVDVSNAVVPSPFKYPVAMTRAAYEATIAAGGKWKSDGDGETLELPGGQDVQGRMHDVFHMLIATMRNPRLHSMQRANTCSDRVYFSVHVDVHGNGRHATVELYSLCGPGDTAAPVLTILLQGED
jgi:hypothetical protein